MESDCRSARATLGVKTLGKCQKQPVSTRSNGYTASTNFREITRDLGVGSRRDRQLGSHQLFLVRVQVPQLVRPPVKRGFSCWHNRSDCPEIDPELQVNLVWSPTTGVVREEIRPIPAEIADLIQEASVAGKLVE